MSFSIVKVLGQSPSVIKDLVLQHVPRGKAENGFCVAMARMAAGFNTVFTGYLCDFAFKKSGS